MIAVGAPDPELTRIARAGFSVLALGALVMVAWVVLAPLSGAIIAPAFVKVDMNRKVVQHQEGGIVKQILVRDGERAKAARLEAERAFLTEVMFPPELAARSGEPKVAELLQRETALFRARREALDSQIAVLRKQIRQTEDEAQALAGQIAAEARALKSQRSDMDCENSQFTIHKPRPELQFRSAFVN